MGGDVFGLVWVPHGHRVAGQSSAGTHVLWHVGVVWQHFEQCDQVVGARRPLPERDKDSLERLLSRLLTVETQRLQQQVRVSGTGAGDGQVAARVTEPA
jgi:hypothetical protein